MIFPSTNEHARYDPQAISIVLNFLSQQEYDLSLQREHSMKAIEVFPTISHELTHWADSISTIWGQNYFKKVFDSHIVSRRFHVHGNEVNFHKLISLHDASRRLKFENYYKVQKGDPKSIIKNGYNTEISSGIEFDYNGRPDLNRPVIFVRVVDKIHPENYIRQPICVAALLEVIATWSEIKTANSILPDLLPYERTFSANTFNDTISRNFNDPELSLYSAPVHLLKRYCSIESLSDAYMLAANISQICLNLTGSHYRKLGNSPKIKEFKDDWSRRLSKMAEREYASFAYFALCLHSPAWSGDLGDWIEKLLKNCGLQDYIEIMDNASRNIKSINITNENSEDVDLKNAHDYMKNIGIEIIKYRKENKDSGLSFYKNDDKNFPITPMFLHNEDILELPNSRWDYGKIDPQKFFDYGAKLHTNVNNFIKACR